jgi:hypothetical protein
MRLDRMLFTVGSMHNMIERLYVLSYSKRYSSLLSLIRALLYLLLHLNSNPETESTVCTILPVC